MCTVDSRGAPNLSMKLVNENDPGLEFSGASMLPDDEISGEDRAKGIKGSHSSRSIKPAAQCCDDRSCVRRCPACTFGLAGTVGAREQSGGGEAVSRVRGLWARMCGGAVVDPITVVPFVN